MSSALKPEDLTAFRQMLQDIRARLRGDLDQMTHEALRGSNSDDSNLQNAPIHLDDVGSENYDQEFTLSLIENEQETLEQIHEALLKIDAGSYGRCEECEGPIAKARLQALPYTRYCINCAREMESRG